MHNAGSPIPVLFATANQSARRPSICLVHAREQAGIIRADISARHDWASLSKAFFLQPKDADWALGYAASLWGW